MFVNSENVNILTSLLLQHGVREAVVCPGSRNAPIVHNLNACGEIRCWPVTDERSAGFFALGMAQATRQPVVVCVTSGTAVLNLAPAVAEAFYQHVPLVVVSADRPEPWIGQLDGQTLPQQHVFGPLVRKAVALPVAVDNDTDRWHCNRLVNEAMLATSFPVAGPVHINVPIAEPLFRFDVDRLPDERVIRRMASGALETGRMVVRRIMEAERPMVVVGQHYCDYSRIDKAACQKGVTFLRQQGVWLSERLTDLSDHSWHVDEAMAVVGEDASFLPDLVVYMGETVVSKRLRQFLRRAEHAEVMMVTADGEVSDVTMHATQVVVASPEDVLLAAAEASDSLESSVTGNGMAYREQWDSVLRNVAQHADDYMPPFSQMAAVRYLEEQLEDLELDYDVHYANSMAVRLANIYAGHPVWCNRGVNGIDGSVSTAVGFAAVKSDDHMVVCVTGDLSFFYDQNALWNQNLKGNLRVVLLNNGRGGIFGSLPGLRDSNALHHFVGGDHSTHAEGICMQNDIGYIRATDTDAMKVGMVRLLTERTRRPMVLEVVTDADTDNAVVGAYYKMLTDPTR